jgi:diguanylate cyclase (GGDEF)-like protein/PAS domain S-box-containing protein
MDPKPAAKPATASATLNDAVRAEQIRLLIENHADRYITLLVAAIVIEVVWGIYPGWLLGLWFGLSLAVVVIRSLLARRFLAIPRDAAAVRRWSVIFSAGAAATGILWGCTGSITLVSASPGLQFFSVMILGGMMAGGVMVDAAYFPAMAAFAIPAVVPGILVFFMQGDSSHAFMGVLLALFSAVIIAGAMKLNRVIVQNIRMRFGRDDLLAQLVTSESAMAEAQQLAKVGSWDVDLLNDIATWSRETYRIFGVDLASFKPSLAIVTARVHPDDRDAVIAHLTDMTSAADASGIDHRIVMDDGGIKFVHETRRLIFDATGTPRRMVGSVQDVTARRLAEDRLQFANLVLKTQMQASPDGILVVDASRHATDFNRRFAEIWHIPDAELRAGNDGVIRARISAQVADPATHNARVEYLAEHPEEVGNETLETTDGRTLERYSRAMRSAAGEELGRVWFFRDITAEASAARALGYRDRLMHAVTAATGIAVRAISLAEGVPVALGKIGDSMGVQRVLVIQEMPRDTPPLVLHFLWEAPGIAVHFTLSDKGSTRFDPAQMAAWRRPLSEGRHVTADAATATGAVAQMLAWYGIKSSILVPVYVGGLVWGFISADDCEANRQWTASEIETLGILADIAGALIVRERARIALEASEANFRLLTATAKDAVILTGPGGAVLQWNPAAERIFGYSAAEAMGRQAVALIVRPEERERVRRGMENASASLAITLEFIFLRKDGTEVATEISVSAMQIGAEQGILSILRDITERKTAEAKLKFANVLFKTQMEASPDGILVVDAKRTIVSFNQRFADMWAIPVALLEAGDADPVRDVLANGTTDPAGFMTRARQLLERPDEISDDELETNDGRFIDRHSRSLQSTGAENFGRVWFFRDVTARRNAEALALRLARSDVLTGLANRAVFVEAVRHAIAQARRGGNGFAVLYLDLDHFKDINDTLGHTVGDAFLKAVADRLRAHTTETDVIGRFGGDEFAMVACEIKDPGEAAAIAENLINAIAVPFFIENNEINAAVSIGIDLFGPTTADAETLLAHADVALYRAKAEGRGIYRFFTEAMDREVRARVKLGTELRVALASDQMFLVYQPQVAPSTGRVTGMEALVRWRHPTRGVLSPGYFIPVAETTGVIGLLGHFVLWEACRQAKAWLDAGLTFARIGVNVSALQFRTPLALEADVTAALKHSGLPPHLLELELTESALMDASREHNYILIRLREMGVRLAIDDFGTGFSSLDYLRRFPADHIKIAQTFTRNIETAAGDATIVRAIIGLAHELNISVIVEGVETKAQLELIRKWGFSEVQGFYFARPMEAEAITGLLRKGGIIKPEMPQLRMVE